MSFLFHIPNHVKIRSACLGFDLNSILIKGDCYAILVIFLAIDNIVLPIDTYFMIGTLSCINHKNRKSIKSLTMHFIGISVFIFIACVGILLSWLLVVPIIGQHLCNIVLWESCTISDSYDGSWKVLSNVLKITTS